MGHITKEIVYLAGIRVATTDILGPPFDEIDFARNVVTQHIVVENFVEWNVRIVDTDKNDSGFPTSVDKNLVEDFRHGNFPSLGIEINFSGHSFCIIKFNDSMCASVNVQRQITIRCQPSASIFDSSPENDVKFLRPLSTGGNEEKLRPVWWSTLLGRNFLVLLK